MYIVQSLIASYHLFTNKRILFDQHKILSHIQTPPSHEEKGLVTIECFRYSTAMRFKALI